MAGHFKDAMGDIALDTQLSKGDKNPKGTAEGWTLRAKPGSIQYSSRSSFLMYFIPRRCHPFPELIFALKKRWVKSQRSILNCKGEPVLGFSPKDIVNAFNVPPTPGPVELINREAILPWRDSLLAKYILRWYNTRAGINLHALPEKDIPVPDAKTPLGFLLVLITILCGCTNDTTVDLFQLALAYLICDAENPRFFNFAVFLSDAIEEQFDNMDVNDQFTHVSLVAWMFLYQNSSLFPNLNIEKFDENGNLKSVDAWTQDIRNTSSYVDAVNNFLVPALMHIEGGAPIPRLSQEAKDLLQQPLLEKGDWYFTDTVSHIRLYGFDSNPFVLPKYVSDWIFGIEYARQIDYIDFRYGSQQGKKSCYSLPLRAGSITIEKRDCHAALKAKLASLKLVELSNAWCYDPKGIFVSNLKLQSQPPKFVAKRMKEIEDLANSEENAPIVAQNIVLTEVLPAWRAFYPVKKVWDGKPVALSKAINKWMAEEEWDQNKKQAFLRYRVESGTINAPKDNEWDQIFDSKYDEWLQENEAAKSVPPAEEREYLKGAGGVALSKRKKKDSPDHTSSSHGLVKKAKVGESEPISSVTTSMFSMAQLVSGAISYKGPVSTPSFSVGVSSSELVNSSFGQVVNTSISEVLNTCVTVMSPVSTSFPVSSLSPLTSLSVPVDSLVVHTTSCQSLVNVSPVVTDSESSMISSEFQTQDQGFTTPVSTKLAVTDSGSWMISSDFQTQYQGFTTPVSTKPVVSPMLCGSLKSPITKLSEKEVFDGIMAQFIQTKPDQNQYLLSQYSKIPTPDDQVQIRSHHDPKEKTLQLAVMQRKDGGASVCDTALKIDLNKVSRVDKNDLIQTMIGVNATESAKLEASLNKEKKRYKLLLEQHQTQKRIDKATIKTLTASLKAASNSDVLAQKELEIANLKANISNEKNKVSEKEQEINSLNLKVSELQRQLDTQSMSVDILKKSKARFCNNLLDDSMIVVVVRDYVDTGMKALNQLKALITQKEDELKKLQDEAKKAYMIINNMSDAELNLLEIGSRVDVLLLMDHSRMAEQIIKESKLVIPLLENEVMELMSDFQELEKLGLPSFWNTDGSATSTHEMKKNLQDMAGDESDIQGLSSPVTEHELLEFFERLTNIKNKIKVLCMKKQELSYENINRVILFSGKIDVVTQVNDKMRRIMDCLITTQAKDTSTN